uniref:C-type lectin domain-containing protein n=1 Tax=Cyprinus carpio carpio TaxID=630221 RepID=A0A8C1BYC2_CYPCA
MNKGMIMDSEDRIERTVDIYISAEAVRDMKDKKDTEDFNTTKTQTPQHTGSDGVNIRSSRAAVVCLVLLCVFLLTAVIVLCVTFTQERQQIITKITNLAEERDQLLTNNMNLTQEREQLLTNNMNLTQEREQLLTNNKNLTQERNQLLTNILNVTKERDQLKSEKNELQKLFAGGWKCHQSSLYFLSSEKKSWSGSRKYCTDKKADLISINNQEEQDFVKNISGGKLVWIGLTDTDVEGTWKWVDRSNMNFRFWETGQQNNIEEDCALTRSTGWADFPCERFMQFPVWLPGSCPCSSVLLCSLLSSPEPRPLFTTGCTDYHHGLLISGLCHALLLHLLTTTSWIIICHRCYHLLFPLDSVTFLLSINITFNSCICFLTHLLPLHFFNKYSIKDVRIRPLLQRYV